MSMNRTGLLLRNISNSKKASTPTSMPPIKPKSFHLFSRTMSGCKYVNNIDWVRINNTPKNINFNKDLNRYANYRNEMIYKHNQLLRNITNAQINLEIKRQMEDINWETEKALEHAFNN